MQQNWQCWAIPQARESCGFAKKNCGFANLLTLAAKTADLPLPTLVAETARLSEVFTLSIVLCFALNIAWRIR